MASPAPWTNLVLRIQNLTLQSTFPIKLYHNSNFEFSVNFVLSLEDYHSLDQISDKAAERHLEKDEQQEIS